MKRQGSISVLLSAEHNLARICIHMDAQHFQELLRLNISQIVVRAIQAWFQALIAAEVLSASEIRVQWHHKG